MKVHKTICQEKGHKKENLDLVKSTKSGSKEYDGYWCRKCGYILWYGKYLKA